MIAYGFLFGPPPTYICDSWNRLDGMLVSVSVIDVTFKIIGANAGGMLRILRIARLLRTLRPLRLISRAPKLKLVVRTLMTAMETIGNTVAISGIIFLIFAILGIQLFSGKMQYCQDASGERNETVIQLEDCASSGGSVETHTFNYDHIGNALLTLFYVASFDGWVDQMLNGVDAVDDGKNMQRDHSPAMALFFVAFLLVGNFFILNMFIGVIVDSFQRALEPDEGLSIEELRARDKEKKRVADETRLKEEAEEAAAADISYIKDYEDWQLKVWTLASTSHFDIAITVIITLNVLTMALEHYDQSTVFTFVLDMLNYLFSFIFTCEMLIKVQAHSCVLCLLCPIMSFLALLLSS